MSRNTQQHAHKNGADHRAHDDGARVACDGVAPSDASGVPGHPRVFLSFRGADKVVCPYCSREFTRSAE